MLRYALVLFALPLVACTSAPPPQPTPMPTALFGMWSDPPPTALGTLCFFACTDAAIERLNALLDDPANDARPFPQLAREAQDHERDSYLRPRLTEEALKTYPVDPADDPGLLQCEPWGLARQMFAPHQLEIRRSGDSQIELRYGEWEAVRTVYLDGRPPPAGQAPSRLGHSVGRWEGETFVVETSHVAANITRWNTKHSDQLRATERFTRSDDRNTLHLTATIEDPWSLREPIVAKKIWRWAPDQKITPYDSCEPATDVKKGTRES